MSDTAEGTLIVPGDLPAMPCIRCFRLIGTGCGPLALPRCKCSTRSVRCENPSCHYDGNCRPLPGLMAGDLYVFLVLVGAVEKRPALAANGFVATALRHCGHTLRLAMNSHLKKYGLTGRKINLAKAAEYAQSVSIACSAVSAAMSGRKYLLRLRPENTRYAVVRAQIAAAAAIVAGRAGPVLGEEEAEALWSEISWAVADST